MTKHQKQLLVSAPITIVSLLILCITFPIVWIALIFILPFIAGFIWSLVSLGNMLVDSGFGKWLTEDDK